MGSTATPVSHWRILFNGEDCENPGKIESLHKNSQTDVDHHKASGSMFRADL